jgi:hypothetical protein
VREKEIKALRTSIKNRFWKLIKTPKILSKSAKELIKDAGWIKSEDFEKNFYTQKPIRETKVKTAFF